MKNESYFENKRYKTTRAGTDQSRRAMLMAMREAELTHWQATGGDFLSTSPRVRTAKDNVRGGGAGLLWRVLIVGISATLLAGCSGSNAQSSAAMALPPEVPVHRVVEMPIPARFEFTGQTTASHQVEVRARVGGYVINVPYAEGEPVEAGTLLFEIDPRPFLAVHAKAEAEVSRARATAKLAQQELARAELLSSNDAIAGEEVERRRTELATATAALASAVAQRESAALDVEFTKVKAPVAGRVSRALVRPGNLISGGDAGGTLLTTLVAVSPLHVLFTVDEPAYERVTAYRATGTGLRAELKLGSGDGVVEGQLNYLAPTLDARSGTAQARLVVANADGRLAPGMVARVTLMAESELPRVLVPETAIGAQQGSRFVLVVGKDNKIEHRQVVLGERRGGDRVVTSGLSAGESIVINGLQRVSPGMAVQPVEGSIASK